MRVRVELPAHLRTLAQTGAEIQLDVPSPVTQQTLLDAVEAAYPVLRGTIRDRITLKRRAYIRFFACQQDLSHNSPEEPLPAPIQNGAEPFLILGAISGGLEILLLSKSPVTTLKSKTLYTGAR